MRRDAIKTTCVAVFVIMLVMLQVFANFVPFWSGTMSNISCIIYRVEHPTLFEMINFISVNKIDERQYTENYVCHNFAIDFIRDARAQGMQAGYVTLHHFPIGHSIISIQTTDSGLFFLEPQNDYIFTQNEFERMISKGTYLFDPQNTEGIPVEYYSINWLIK
jgi:hypothetical protein